MEGEAVMNEISRREFLRVSALATAGAAVVACQAQTEAPTTAPEPAAATPTTAAEPTATPTPEPVSQYGEAPQFAEMVQAGSLAPVDERMPQNPMVVKPRESIGQYGGTLDDVNRIGNDYHILHVMQGNNLVRFTPEIQVIPDVSESFEASDDATEFTFYLRKGHKWDDGEPHTVDDWMFYYEDVYSNEELTTAKPKWITPSDQPMVIEKIDDYTMKWVFQSPNGLFLQVMAGPNPRNYTTARHYMEQFHADYNKENLDALIEENNVGDWVSLFGNKNNYWRNAEKPCLDHWPRTQTPGEDTQQAIGERNPYYHKVDPEGNQLPYIDRAIIHWIEDNEVVLMKKLNGEFDLCGGGSDKEKAMFIENQEKGDYHLYESTWSGMNRMIVTLNLCHKDPVKREIYQNKDFRIGLSYAINRQEIIDAVYQGQGEPWQLAPIPASGFYNETLAKQYTEYDVAKANEHLDQAGYEKGTDGKRLGPDGKPISILIETFQTTGSHYIDSLELIKGYFAEVGVDMEVKQIDRGLFYERKGANEHDATAYGGDGGLEVLLEPRWYFPNSIESNYAIQWAYWYIGDPRAGDDVPPPAAQKQMELYDQIVGTGDAEKQAELMNEILEIAQQEFWAIGTVSITPGYAVCANNLHNAPTSRYGLWRIPGTVWVIPEQLYFDPVTD
jgi:peptide/nickel transport system substrate-binding protein